MASLFSIEGRAEPADPCKNGLPFTTRHFCSLLKKRIPFACQGSVMMRPLRYKSKKSSTCNIRSSNFPLSQFLSTIKHSVRFNTLLAIAPASSSVIDRIYTTFHASIILRPAASLSNYSPCSCSFAEARATRRCLHYRLAPRLYKPPESPGLDIFIRHLQFFHSSS